MNSCVSDCLCVSVCVCVCVCLCLCERETGLEEDGPSRCYALVTMTTRDLDTGHHGDRGPLKAPPLETRVAV